MIEIYIGGLGLSKGGQTRLALHRRIFNSEIRFLLLLGLALCNGTGSHQFSLQEWSFDRCFAFEK